MQSESFRASSDQNALSQEWSRFLELVNLAMSCQDVTEVIADSLKFLAPFLPYQYAFVLAFKSTSSQTILAYDNNLPHALGIDLESLELPAAFVEKMDSPESAAEFGLVENALRQMYAAFPSDAPIFVSLQDAGRMNGVLVLAVNRHPEAHEEWFALRERHAQVLTAVGNLIGNALGRAGLEHRGEHSVQWYRAFVEESLDAFWETDAAQNIVYANRAMANILGIPHEELIGKSMYWLHQRLPPLSPEDANRMQELLHITTQQDTVTDYVCRIALADGFRFVSITARVVRDSEGCVTRMQGSARDVTPLARVQHELVQRTQELELLHELSLRLNKTIGERETLDFGLDLIARLTDADAIGIWMINKDEGHYDMVAHRGVEPELLDLYATAPFDRMIYQPGFDPEVTWNLVEYLVLTRSVMMTEDFIAMPRFDTSPVSRMGYRSFLVFPMAFDEEVYGTVLVGSKRANQFNKQHRQLGENISAQLGLAIHNQRLIANLQEATEYAGALTRVGRKIQFAPRAEAALSSVVRDMKQALKADYVVIQLLRGEHFEVVTATDAREIEKLHPISEYEHRILDSDVPLVVPDCNAPGADEKQHAILTELKLRSSISMRLYAHDHPLGILFVNQETIRKWNDAQTDFVKRAAQQIAYALENKRLLDETKQQLSELQALARAARLIGSVVPIEHAFQIIADEMARVLAVDYVGFHLRQDNFLDMVAESGYSGAARIQPVAQHQLRILDELDTVVVNDRDNETLPLAQHEVLKKHAFCADLGVPLFVSKKAIGLVYLSSHAPRRWSESDVSLAETFAHQVASAVENTRLFNALQGQVRDLRALARSANFIATSRSLQDALPHIAFDLRRTLEADYVGFHMLDGDQLVVMTDPRQEAAGLRYPLSDYHRLALSNNQRIVVNDVDQDCRDADHRATLLKYNFKADVGAPMVNRSKALGLLFVRRAQPHMWTQDELQLIETFAQQIASVLDIVQLLDEKETRLHELEQLTELNEVTSTILDEDLLQDMALAALKNLFQSDHVSLMLMDGDNFRATHAADGIVHPQQPPRMTPFLLQALKTKKHFIYDPQHPQEMDAQTRERIAFYGTRSALSVPMVAGDEAIGLLNFTFRSPHVYSEAEIRLAQSAANQLGMAFANARLVQEQKTRIDKLMQLSDFGLYCGAIHNSQSLQDMAVKRICTILEAKAASVRWVENDLLIPGASYGYRDNEMRDHPIAVDARMQTILQQRRLHVIRDLENQTDVPEHWRKRHLAEAFHSLIMTPMIAENQVIGILTVYRDNAHEWSKLQLQYAQTLANTLALAISNVRQKETIEHQSGELQATMDSVFSGVLTTDDDGSIISWTRQAERITGYLAQEMLGKHWDVDGPRVGVLQRDDTLILEAMADNETHFSLATRLFTCADGHVISLREVATPLRDRGGSVRGAVCAFWDRVEEQEGERNRVDFINEVAHQLGNKLGAVIMSAQQLQRADLPDKTRERFIRVIADTMTDLENFQKRFIAFQRERAREEVQETEVDLRRLMDEKIAPLRVRTPKHQFRVGGQFDFVYADPQRLGVVIENLLDNAFKYSPPSTRITVTAACPAPDQLVLQINNKGKPIPPELQARLFERWQRGRSDKPGSGLGLWLVRTKLHEMGGEIHFESTTRGGTTFYVTLPRPVHQIPGATPETNAGIGGKNE